MVFTFRSQVQQMLSSKLIKTEEIYRLSVVNGLEWIKVAAQEHTNEDKEKNRHQLYNPGKMVG